MCMCGVVGYVCCMLCYRSSIWALVPQNLFLFANFFINCLLLCLLSAKRVFFDPWSDPIRSRTLHNKIQRFLRSFDRIWKKRRKHILILKIHNQITVIASYHKTLTSHVLLLIFQKAMFRVPVVTPRFPNIKIS